MVQDLIIKVNQLLYDDWLIKSYIAGNRTCLNTNNQITQMWKAKSGKKETGALQIINKYIISK